MPESLFSLIVRMVDILFSPLLLLPPAIAVALLAFLTTFVVILASRFLINRKEFKEIKVKSHELKERMVKAEKNSDKKEMERILDEMLKINSLMLKNTMKVLFISLLIGILTLPWLAEHYSKEAMFILPISLPVIGNKITWVIWYVIVGFIFSFVLNKLIGIGL